MHQEDSKWDGHFRADERRSEGKPLKSFFINKLAMRRTRQGHPRPF